MTKVSDETKQDKNVKLNAMPAFNLKMIDRFFLAVTKKSNGALTMVYTLGCNSSEKYKYDAYLSIRQEEPVCDKLPDRAFDAFYHLCHIPDPISRENKIKGDEKCLERKRK